MEAPNRTTDTPEAAQPQEAQSAQHEQASSWDQDLKQTLKLGEEVIAFAGGVIDLARTEALLAIKSAPKLMMLWLITMPIILLTWCAFSTLMAWVAFALSGGLGWAMLAFLLLQVLLLIVCRSLYVRYRTRMSLPYTRAHIDNFMRSAKYEFKRQSEIKK